MKLPFLKGDKMWLPKLERDLLVYYYKKFQKLPATHLVISDVFEVDLDEFIRECRYISSTKVVRKIDDANVRLTERELIGVTRLLGGGNYGKRDVRLSIEAKDLGRKYNNFFDRVGLWCAAIEHRWLWAIIIFLAGCLVKWLFDLLLMIIKNNK